MPRRRTWTRVIRRSTVNSVRMSTRTFVSMSGRFVVGHGSYPRNSRYRYDVLQGVFRIRSCRLSPRWSSSWEYSDSTVKSCRTPSRWSIVANYPRTSSWRWRGRTLSAPHWWNYHNQVINWRCRWRFNLIPYHRSTLRESKVSMKVVSEENSFRCWCSSCSLRCTEISLPRMYSPFTYIYL